MKIIKKIAAIMLSVMMVLGMCSVVGAEETSGSYGDNNGTITIKPAIEGQKYTIYRMLKLESFSGDNYSYKAEDKWKTFVKDVTNDDGQNYFIVDADGYVKWNSAITKDADKAELAKEALAYANTSSNEVTTPEEYKKTADKTKKVEYTNLPLGYYLVDSSVGALCGLTTTHPAATIEEKNGVPSVEKKVQEDSKKGAADEYGESNTADIGQTVNFKTTITAQVGAQNYVLHDKMDAGLTFKDDVQIQWIKKSDNTTTPLTKGTDYDVTTTDLESTDPKCTFHVTFKSDFCDKLAKDDTIVITYSATLNEEAVIAGDGNKNETWLKYGDSSVTTHKTTTTKTYEIPVFKYTKKTAENKTGLPNAEFTLSKNTDGTNPIKLVDIMNGAAEGKYRVAKTGEATTTDKVITPATGKFTIQGLDADIYYLTETKQPDGYNKLSKAVKIVIDEKGNITVDDKTPSTELVEVENKSGSLLPSTGGMGTTLFYIFGAILVIGSGVVLITKKRMK